MRSGKTKYARIALALCSLGCLAQARAAAAQEAGAAVYVRSESDDTLVVAPRARAQTPALADTKFTAIYAADIWSSASVDIRTSASRVPVTEQRDELDFSLDHEREDLTLTAAYRFSHEPDYVSNGGSGGFSYDFASNNSTIAVGVSGSSDQVGRAGDPSFSESSSTLGGRLSFTQVLGVGTLGQATYEISRAGGYLASPYRRVAIGEGSCTSGTGEDGLSELCVVEVVPDERLRHAAALELRQLISDAWSFGAAYRFYTDSWGVLSHTARAELAFLPDADTILAARYRFYIQGPADFYQAHYAEPAKYVTSDKELSPLSSHRAAIELDRTWRFDSDRKLSTIFSAAAQFYNYSDFPPLTQMTAFEFSVAMVFVP
ncbi:MAG TPA: DUF3570 domain-containing protein [Polyangiales bacterium]|nr:DUF3570 domain-containing protein [Polyangiales bacterium]